MLHAAVNFDDAIRGTRHANRRLGLHVGVLDGLRLELFLDDEIRLAETCLDIAAPDDVRVDDVRAVVFMDERRTRQHRRLRIEHGGQRFGIHLHQLRRVNRNLARFRDDDGDNIAVVTNLVVGEDAEIADDLAETVCPRHILRGQHADHAGNSLGSASVNRDRSARERNRNTPGAAWSTLANFRSSVNFARPVTLAYASLRQLFCWVAVLMLFRLVTHPSSGPRPPSPRLGGGKDRTGAI